MSLPRPRLRHLSGEQVIRILRNYGFEVHSQRGSHAKLHRTRDGSVEQVLTVPRHRVLDPGTLHAIFRQARRFIPEDQLRKDFYSE